MSDDRLRRMLHGAADGLDADADQALRRVLSGARRRRLLRRVVTGAIGTLTLAGLVAAAPVLVRSFDLPQDGIGRAGGTGLAPSPGVEAPFEQCARFSVRGAADVERARLICGVVPPSRRVEGGTAYRVTTTTGQRIWVAFSDLLRGSAEHRPIVVPGVLLSFDGQEPWDAPQVELTTADPAEAVEDACRLGRCRATTDPELLPSGATMQRWAAGTFVTTVDMGRWTAVMCCSGTLETHERAARAFTWSDTDDLFLTLGSTDPGVGVSADWASVLPWFSTNTGGHSMRILPGCSLDGRDPDLGGRATYGPELDYAAGKDGEPPGSARWCAGGYLVDVDEVDPGEAREFHNGLRVVENLEAAVPIVGPTPTA